MAPIWEQLRALLVTLHSNIWYIGAEEGEQTFPAANGTWWFGWDVQGMWEMKILGCELKIMSSSQNKLGMWGIFCKLNLYKAYIWETKTNKKTPCIGVALFGPLQF